MHKSKVNLILIALALILLIIPVKASEEAVVDYHAHKVAENFMHLCEYEKAREVHDYLIINVQYDYTYSDNSFKAYGALVEGRAVCQGYSLAYREILLHLGMECDVYLGIAGNGFHAWNLITVNNVGYFVDVTWDDKDDGKIYYEWFMITQIKDHYVMFTIY